MKTKILIKKLLEFLENIHSIDFSRFSTSQLIEFLRILKSDEFKDALIIHSVETSKYLVSNVTEFKINTIKELFKRWNCKIDDVITKLSINFMNINIDEYFRNVLCEFCKIPQSYRYLFIDYVVHGLELEIKLIRHSIERKIEELDNVVKNRIQQFIEDICSKYSDNVIHICIEKILEFHFDPEIKQINKLVDKLKHVEEKLCEVKEKLKLLAKGYVEVKIKLKDETIINSSINEIFEKVRKIEI